MDLKKARKEKGFTQAELADKAGISSSILSRYENGEVIPPPEKLAAISKALDMNIITVPDGSYGKGILIENVKSPDLSSLRQYYENLTSLNKSVITDDDFDSKTKSLLKPSAIKAKFFLGTKNEKKPIFQKIHQSLLSDDVVEIVTKSDDRYIVMTKQYYEDQQTESFYDRHVHENDDAYYNEITKVEIGDSIITVYKILVKDNVYVRFSKYEIPTEHTLIRRKGKDISISIDYTKLRDEGERVVLKTFFYDDLLWEDPVDSEDGRALKELKKVRKIVLMLNEHPNPAFFIYNLDVSIWSNDINGKRRNLIEPLNLHNNSSEYSFTSDYRLLKAAEESDLSKYK